MVSLRIPVPTLNAIERWAVETGASRSAAIRTLLAKGVAAFVEDEAEAKPARSKSSAPDQIREAADCAEAMAAARRRAEKMARS
jgi:hypothetical protein